MAKNIDILVLDDPTIELEELSIDDIESGTENQESFVANNSVKSNSASLSPIVKINNFVLNATYLTDFSIDCTGFVPTCNLSFYDITEQFTEVNYPKDGDLMKVYIGTGGKEETWKPIRIDFQILSVSNYNDEGVTVFDISGEMEIPGLELDKCEVFKDKTSFDACREIAKNLKLGFASNVQGSDDAQIWINNYTTESKFMSKIIQHAYVDENSFVTAYIDPYYYLTYVECNNIVNDADNDSRGIEELDKIKYVSDSINMDPELKDTEENIAPDFITNSNIYSASNIGIAAYGPVNNCGSIVQSIGKKIYTRYWDDNEEEYRVEFITPFISEGQNLKQMTQSENNEKSVKENTKKVTMRAQTDNMHKNYNYAEICNMMNLNEIDKYGLDVKLAGFNPEIVRFQKKYVAIYTKSPFVKTDIDKNEKLAENDEEQIDAEINKVLSGFYTVTGITYELEEGYLTTNLNLRKRAIKTI